MPNSATYRAIWCKGNILEKYAGGIHFPISAELKAVSPNVHALFLCLSKKILGWHSVVGHIRIL